MRIFIVPIIICSLIACKAATKYPYAIRDFDKRLQPYLDQLVSRGILDSNLDIQDTLKNELDKEDLHKLSNCEIPILRAFGMFTLIHLQKEKAEQLDVAFSHLDDTARVDVDMGEFGIYRFSVTDYLLNNFNAKIMDSMLSKKLVCELLQNRPYLRSTYSSIDNLKMRPEYYPLIKKLVVEDKKPALIYEDFEGGDAEHLLLEFASFEQKEDIPIIRDKLIKFITAFESLLSSNYGLRRILDVLTRYPNAEFINPIQMLTDKMILWDLSDEKLRNADCYADQITLKDFFAAIAAQESQISKAQLVRLHNHYKKGITHQNEYKRIAAKQSLFEVQKFIREYNFQLYNSIVE